MSNNKQSSVEWFSEKTFNLIELMKRNWVSQEEFLDGMLKLRDEAKAMENEQKNNLPIHIHEGIENTWVYIEDGIVHVKPKPKANEQQ